MDRAAEEAGVTTVVTRELPVYHIDLDLYAFISLSLIRSFELLKSFAESSM